MLTGGPGRLVGGGPLVRLTGGSPISASVALISSSVPPPRTIVDDAAEGLLVPAGRVFAAFLAAVAVDRRPDVEAAVRLAQRADVGEHAVVGEEVVELQEVVVALPERDLLRRDQLRQRLVVGGGDVEDRPRFGFAPAFVGLVEAVAPGVEGLQQRRVLAQQRGEFVEVRGRALVADAEEDAAASAATRRQRRRPARRRAPRGTIASRPRRGGEPPRHPQAHRPSFSGPRRAPARRRCRARWSSRPPSAPPPPR